MNTPITVSGKFIQGRGEQEREREERKTHQETEGSHLDPIQCVDDKVIHSIIQSVVKTRQGVEVVHSIPHGSHCARFDCELTLT